MESFFFDFMLGNGKRTKITQLTSDHHSYPNFIPEVRRILKAVDHTASFVPPETRHDQATLLAVTDVSTEVDGGYCRKLISSLPLE
jgi:hypothetical protein